MDFTRLSEFCFNVNNIYKGKLEKWKYLSDREKCDYSQIVKAFYRSLSREDQNSFASCADQNKSSE